MSLPAYPTQWNDPIFVTNAKFLVENRVKLPHLVKIGLIHSDQRDMFSKYIRVKRMKPSRGRAVVTVDLSDKELRSQLSTALNIYNRQAIASLVVKSGLATGIVRAYMHFNQLCNADFYEVKLTLERFIVAVTEEAYQDISMEECNKCGSSFISSGGLDNNVYKCCLCDWSPVPITALQYAAA